jgi:ATPase family associated with various cellular activities (AAA)
MDIQLALHRLDERLSAAIAQASETYGPDAATDPNRGLYVSDAEVENLLHRPPGEPLFAANTENLPTWGDADVQLRWLQQTYALTEFDLEVIVIAIAPVIDRRYERIYAYLQDDVTQRHPTVDLALHLLCHSAADRLTQRSRFGATAPLLTSVGLQLVADPHHVQPTLLAHYLRLDDQIAQFLIGQPGLDARLIPFCTLSNPDANPNFTELVLPLEISIQQLITRSPKLYLQARPGIGKYSLAKAIATAQGLPLLTADLMRAWQLRLEILTLVRLLVQAAQIHNAVLYVPAIDQLADCDEGLPYQQALEAFAIAIPPIILAGSQPWIPTTPQRVLFRPIVLTLPTVTDRQECWRRSLSSPFCDLAADDLAVVADRFRLTAEQIVHAATTAAHQIDPDRSYTPAQLRDLLFTAARQQSGHDLQSMTDKITARYDWTDLILPPDPLAQLQELCSQFKYRHLVYQTWGFDRKLALGKGLTALFVGGPGTGKTMAAEVIATDLGLDLYRIDLSQIVSKYIGETEKNLDRIFQAAESANAILFFDEADALFGKRSDVKDAHDRYANIEVGYLLQKIETYEGLAILATNLRQNLDDAFIRRLQFIVEFPFPDEDHRRQILAVLFPSGAPVAQDLDLQILAQNIRLAGGHLKNIVVAAAFYAAADRDVIQMKHLFQAAQREHQKVGRTWQLEDLSNTL